MVKSFPMKLNDKTRREIASKCSGHALANFALYVGSAVFGSSVGVVAHGIAALVCLAAAALFQPTPTDE